MTDIDRPEIDMDYWSTHCEICRAPIEQPASGRRRKTCSARCRKARSRRTPNPQKRQERADREARQRAERTLAEWEARYGPYDDTAPQGGISPRARLRMYLMRGAPLNYCRRCGRPTLLIDAVGQAEDLWGRREDPGFCSETCARAYHAHQRAVYKALREFEGDYDPVVKVRARYAGAEGLGVCVKCGRPFPDYKVGRKHCSKACRQGKWRRRRKKCVECGEWFSPKGNNHQFCRPQCGQNRRNRQYRYRKRQHFRPVIHCAQCGEVFKRDIRNGRRHRFCSPLCRKRSQRQREKQKQKKAKKRHEMEG